MPRSQATPFQRITIKATKVTKVIQEEIKVIQEATMEA